MENLSFNPQKHFNYPIVVGGTSYTLLEVLKMSSEASKDIFDKFLSQKDNVKSLLGEDYKNLEEILNKGYSFEDFVRLRNLQHQMPPSAAEYEHNLSAMDKNGKGLTEDDDEDSFVKKSEETLSILLKKMGIENKKE